MNRFAALPALLLFVTACGTSDDDDVGITPDSGVVRDGGNNRDAGGELDAGDIRDGGDNRDGGDRDGGVRDGGFVPPEYGRWLKYEPQDAECANGTPYKIFVKFSETSSNAVVFFEGGGACWDYASCTGTGVRSAANVDGLPDDHATAHVNVSGLSLPVDVVYPLLHADPAVNPMHDWNKIFIPYCTGDVYSGAATVIYEDPAGIEPDVEFRHHGHENVLKAIDTLKPMFPQIPRMFVGGCSAGGTGAMVNYHFLRSGLGVQKGYLLDDSGPLFPDTDPLSWSRPLHDRVRAAWNVDALLRAAPQPAALTADFGALPRVLGEEYPGDRLAHTHFRLDYNYSLYSYERFYEVDESNMIVPFGDGMGLGPLGLDENDSMDRSAVYQMWWDDTALLRAQFDAVNNLAYFMPFYRDTNNSHCVTIPGLEEFPEDEVVDIFLNDFGRLAWAGSEIGTSSDAVNLRGFVEHLLDDSAPLTSYFEDEGEGRFLSCTPDVRYYDEQMCAAAQ